jgi:signal transduction histidine kinase
VRRRWPLIAGILAGAALAALVPLGQFGTIQGWLAGPFLWTPALFAYTLGASGSLWPDLAGAAVLTAALQYVGGEVPNPLLLAIAAGPWLAGRIVWSRRRLAGQLAARTHELEAEQEQFARESVRYERARIARELHDIVAHRLSVMVVQASAGQRAPAGDAGGVAAALASAAEAAAQARAEIGRLAALLSGERPAGPPPGLQLAGELVHRASAAGLAVTCRFDGAWDGLAPSASEAAYRVVQEGVTNALKHAPGAPVDVLVTGRQAEVEVTVENGPAPAGPAPLAASGGGHGLAGMRERITACGGTLTAGPTASGGWRVAACLPADHASRP